MEFSIQELPENNEQNILFTFHFSLFIFLLMKQTIFIIGFMTAGKTREGKRLAKMMNRKFIDLDRLIEEREKKSVAEIFSEKGEKYFRLIESKTLQSLNTSENKIVSCGGGTPCYYNNMNWMLQNGIVVWLNISVDTIVKRLSETKKERPLIKNLEGVELKNFINLKMKEREAFYSKAQIKIDTENISIEKLKDELEKLVSKN